MATIEELDRDYKEMLDEQRAEMAADDANAEKAYSAYLRDKDRAWRLKPPITISLPVDFEATLVLAEACLDCWGEGSRQNPVSGWHFPCDYCGSSGYRLTPAGAAIRALGGINR